MAEHAAKLPCIYCLCIQLKWWLSTYKPFLKQNSSVSPPLLSEICYQSLLILLYWLILYTFLTLSSSCLPPSLLRFISMKFKAVTFIDSSFLNCYFEDVSSVGSFFKNCTFVDSFFYNTGERVHASKIHSRSEHSSLAHSCLLWGVSFHPRKSYYTVGTLHISLNQSLCLFQTVHSRFNVHASGLEKKEWVWAFMALLYVTKLLLNLPAPAQIASLNSGDCC